MFENAYFGKPYKTRDGRKAIYQMTDITGLCHLFTNYEYIEVDCHTGKHDNGICKDNSNYDIVSEWQEEIDEEKLHKISLDESKKYANSVPNCISYNYFISGFKSGYRKAKEL